MMPKLKTHKGAAKRFRLTATGKIKRGHSHARHILTKKSNKRKRLLDIDGLVSKSDQQRVESMLPYGRDEAFGFDFWFLSFLFAALLTRPRVRLRIQRAKAQDRKREFD